MKLRLILALLFCAANGLYAEGEYLEPAEGYFSSYDFAHEYRTHVRDILLKDAPQMPLARMVTLPSFFPEEAISVEEGKRETYTVVFRTSSAPIWESKKLESIKVKVERRSLDKETALLVHEVFFLATSQARYPSKVHQGLDGASFYFISFRVSIGLRAGEVWSPGGGVTGALVSYGNLLREYAFATPEKEASVKARLRSDGQSLLKRLRKNR